MALAHDDLLRLLESLRSADGLEIVRAAAERVLQELIEAEATQHIGAAWGEHAETRTAYRNGHRERTLTTQAGDLEPAIPKLRADLLPQPPGTPAPRRPGPLRRHHRGIRPWRVHPQCRRPGQSPRLGHRHLQERGLPDLRRPRRKPHRLPQPPPGPHPLPYVYLDATYLKARVDHQIASRAVVIATGVTEDGGREVLGLMVGDSENETFWTTFLRDLRKRGLNGVRLVISDQHLGLVAAIGKVMTGAAHQRCRVHFVRNVFSVIPKQHAEMAAATIRTIFAQPDAVSVRTQLDTVADAFGKQFPKVKQMLLDAKDELTAFADFPTSTGRRFSRPTRWSA